MLKGLRTALSLDSALLGNRATQGPAQAVKLTHMPSLDQLAAVRLQTTKATGISLSGRYLPLLYRLVSSLVSPPHLYALLIIDLDGRFDATCLSCADTHLRHVYVQRPAHSSPERLRALVAETEAFMLYGDGARASAARQWWGTVVLGSLGAGDLAAGWRGWLRIDREHVRGFALGIGAEEAMEQREKRQEVVDAAGWAATSDWGGFSFKEVPGKDEEEEEEGRNLEVR